MGTEFLHSLTQPSPQHTHYLVMGAGLAWVIDKCYPPQVSYFTSHHYFSPRSIISSVQNLLFILYLAKVRASTETCVPSSGNAQHDFTPSSTQMSLTREALSQPLNKVRLLYYLSPGSINLYFPMPTSVGSHLFEWMVINVYIYAAL